MSLDYVIWLNPERTVMVRRWFAGGMEVALRDDPSHAWGPPITVELREMSPARRESEAA
jgi:uncharacterized protein YfaT (DUF1175 family)